jgi:putative NADPH-quinone reductase
MTQALVLLGHAEKTSFNAALANAYADAFRGAGGSVKLVTLSDLVFDPILRGGHSGEQALEPDLLALRDAFEAARHVAWFFPTYWVSPPAVVRGLVDRLFLPGWAFRYDEGKAFPTRLLRGRSARVVATMDSPAFWYTLANHRAIHGAFVTGTLSFVGFGPIRTTPLYSLRDLDANGRAKVLRDMSALARRDYAKAPRGLPASALALPSP